MADQLLASKEVALQKLEAAHQLVSSALKEVNDVRLTTPFTLEELEAMALFVDPTRTDLRILSDFIISNAKPLIMEKLKHSR